MDDDAQLLRQRIGLRPTFPPASHRSQQRAHKESDVGFEA